MADGNHDLKRGIILDVDGTLWDAVEVITQSWNVVLNTMPDVQGEIFTSLKKLAAAGKDVLWDEAKKSFERFDPAKAITDQ